MKLPSMRAMWQRWVTAAVQAWFWMPQLIKSYGWRFVTMVFFGEHLLKGFLAGGGSSGFFVVESRIYMLMRIGASERQVLSAISGSPWSLKPIFGLISDLLVMFKLRRTPWIIISAILAFICYVIIIIAKDSIPSIIICICFFFGRMQCSWTDLMIESSYTEKMKDVPERASDIVTWVWIGIGLGGLLATVVLSPCLDTLGPFTSVAIPLAISGLPIIPAALGWMTEVPCTTPSCGVRWDVLKQKQRYFATAVVLSIAVLATVGCGIAQVSLMGQCIAAAVCSVGVFVAAILLLPHQLWGPMLFMFLANALALSTYGFVDNFYLDAANAEQSEASGYPICVDCPHFDNYFYTTIVGVWDSLFMVLGSWIFNYYMAGWKYRKALWVTQILLMFASLCDVIQFQRWNKDIGIPDWVFMLGKAALQNTCSMLNFMPTTILIAKLCPIGAEGTVFALLAGFSNFGQSVSSYVGAYVTNWIGLGDIGSGTYDDFSNAWIACLINACLPIAVLFIMPWLIPDARMTDPMMRIGEEESDDKKFALDEDESMEGCDMEDDVADDVLYPQLSGPAPTPMEDGEATSHLREASLEGKAEEDEEEVTFRI